MGVVDVGEAFVGALETIGDAAMVEPSEVQNGGVKVGDHCAAFHRVVVEVIRLESYEDALNNLAEPRRTAAQQRLLDAPDAQGPNRLKEQYLLRYLLDVETRGSQSLLNVRAFTRPHRLQAQGEAARLRRKPRSERRSARNLQLADRPDRAPHRRPARVCW